MDEILNTDDIDESKWKTWTPSDWLKWSQSKQYKDKYLDKLIPYKTAKLKNQPGSFMGAQGWKFFSNPSFQHLKGEMKDENTDNTKCTFI